MTQLSPIDFTSPSYKSVFISRAKMLSKVRSGKKWGALKRYYRDNPVDFINDWGMTFDPRNVERGLPAKIPFLLFPKQAEWVEWVTARWKAQEDGITEKSRDMGLSWLSVAVAVHLWLFYSDTVVGFGSRKEEYVDRSGSPKCLFWKARQFIDMLPVELRPNGWDSQKHAPHMRIINPENGSAIVGEAGDNIGRGDRASIYFKDESAFYERADLIEAAISQTSNCKIDISTPNGTNNAFYRKVIAGKISKFRFHWHDDPRKGQEWYDRQCDILPPHIVAQEIDLDYNASNEGALIPPKYIQAAVKINIEKSGMIRAGLDVADEVGADSNALCVGQGSVIDYIKLWNGENTTMTARKSWGICKDEDVEHITYDSIGVGAGVRGEFSQLKSKDSEYKPRIKPLAVGGAVTKGSVIKGRKNKDMFANLKAQKWWELRVKFEKTFEVVNGIAEHPEDELISIPNDSMLIAELASIKHTINEAGKIIMESKKKMLHSPNAADSVLLFFEKPAVYRL